ncbi:hypothetical protein [Sulfurimonas sp.]|uniref:hypothetical protein n=1 Tax=Sulfurimonas sp. TaxID=2022749 RepID=UPI002616C7D7|nr:hypothetical protein [Sulfurimonas sp.]MDD3450938.1 hypothetical protein [Sulfurimonas sp.]
MEDILFIIGVVIGWTSLMLGLSYISNKIFKKKDIDDSELSSVEIDNTSTTTKKINNDDTNDSLINPVSGGLMMGGMGGIDTFGNSFGSDTCGGFND